MQAAPQFSMVIPSTGKRVKFRPFLVKEERALLIAQQTEELRVMIDTMKSVLSNVVLEKNLDFDKLAIFDLEYMFLQVRGKSVGETVDLLFYCDEDHGSEEQNEKAKAKVTMELDKIEVRKTDGHSNKIHLFDDVGVVMRYPTLDLTESIGDLENIDNIMQIVAELIDVIYDGEEVYNTSDTPKKELLDFVGNLTSEQFQKIQDFFLTMPKLQAEVDFKCPVCGKEHHRTLEGLANFFS